VTVIIRKNRVALSHSHSSQFITFSLDLNKWMHYLSYVEIQVLIH
jgi:hypothetical protein